MVRHQSLEERDEIPQWWREREEKLFRTGANQKDVIEIVESKAYVDSETIRQETEAQLKLKEVIYKFEADKTIEDKQVDNTPEKMDEGLPTQKP